MLAPWKKSYDKPWQHIKKYRHYIANKGPYSQSSGFSSSHVWMWELDHKQGWASKNWCFLTVVLEKTLESPLHCMEMKPVHPKGNQSWIFIGRTDAEAETPILWPPGVKSRLVRKDAEAGKDWRQEKGTTEDEMITWHHQHNGQELEQVPGDAEVQGRLAHYSPWGLKESDTTEWTTTTFTLLICLTGRHCAFNIRDFYYYTPHLQLSKYNLHKQKTSKQFLM